MIKKIQYHSSFITFTKIVVDSKGNILVYYKEEIIGHIIARFRYEIKYSRKLEDIYYFDLFIKDDI